MYTVLVEYLNYGRRTFSKGSPVDNTQIPDNLLKDLEKAGKVKKETKETTKK